jgi:hypothetical protein
MRHLMEAGKQWLCKDGYHANVIYVDTDGWMSDGERLTPVHAPAIIRAAIAHEARYALKHETHAADTLLTLTDALTLAEMDVR